MQRQLVRRDARPELPAQRRDLQERQAVVRAGPELPQPLVERPEGAGGAGERRGVLPLGGAPGSDLDQRCAVGPQAARPAPPRPAAAGTTDPPPAIGAGSSSGLFRILWRLIFHKDAPAICPL